MDIAKSGAGGASINLKDLGIEDMGEVIENMNENEKILEDMQKPFEQKLAEANANSNNISDASTVEDSKMDSDMDISVVKSDYFNKS
jgi:hypothetical protein